MRRVALAILALATACAPAPAARPSPVVSPVLPTGPVVPSPSSALTFVPPTPAGAPSLEPTPAPEPTPPPQVPEPDVTVAAGGFPVLTTLRSRLGVVDDGVTSAARAGVQGYLWSIDQFRNGASPALPITGPFLAAVSTALKESATPGVKRQFEIESLVVDRHVQKPWGTHAYVEVTVRLVDRAVEGSAPDQRETGRLRLTGDRLRVTDGWDYEHDRWFNGFGALPLEQVRGQIVQPLQFYLRLESWRAGSALGSYRAVGDEATPFMRAHAERLLQVDRSRIVAQSFEKTTATIERFETVEGVWSGYATVRLNGTRVTTDGVGAIRQVPYEKRLRVFIFGGWMPEVVDEEISPGVWMSGGELALEKIDVDRA